MHLAAKNGHKEIIKILVGKISTEVKDEEGKTPLYFAFKNEHKDVIKILLEQGADVKTLYKYDEQVEAKLQLLINEFAEGTEDDFSGMTAVSHIGDEHIHTTQAEEDHDINIVGQNF